MFLKIICMKPIRFLVMLLGLIIVEMNSVIFTDNVDNEVYRNQIESLKNKKAGLAERKLVIYQVRPNKWSRGLSATNWKTSKNDFNDFRQSDEPFEVVLVGLDGGVKMSKTSVLSAKELFGTIDVMPMRRQEMKKKDNN